MMRILAISFRLLVFCVTGLFFSSIMVSVLSSAHEESEPRWVGQWDSLFFLGQGLKEGAAQPRLTLIHHETGEFQDYALPDTDHWNSLSVSPWRTEEGRREAVGHCHGLTPAADGETFWGLARINLTDGKVLDRAELDVLPTSRPCWLPSVPGTVLFTAGDGRLHRFRFQGNLEARHQQSSESDGPVFQLIRWKNSAGRNDLHISDPSWMMDPRVRPLLLVSIMNQPTKLSRSLRANSQIWWLELSQDGLTVVDAGKLLGEDDAGLNQSARSRRYPQLAIEAKGKGTLYYLTHGSKRGSMRLESIVVQLDPATGRPSLDPDARIQVIADDCAPSPFVLSADGTTIHRVSARTHEIVTESLEKKRPSESPVAIASGS